MTVGAISVFNEAGNIRPVVENLLPWVDRLIVIDGAYKDFPHNGNNGASDDGTLEVLDDLEMGHSGYSDKLEVVECPGRPWETEMEKRSKFFDMVGDGEWVFILDADERVAFGGPYVQNPEGLRELRPFDRGIVLLAHQDSGKTLYGEMARLYRKKPGTRYGNSHAHVIHDAGHQWQDLHLPVVVEESHALRPPERDAQRLAYYKSGLMK